MELRRCCGWGPGESRLCRKVCVSAFHSRRVSRWREGRVRQTGMDVPTFLRMEVGTRVHLFAGFRHNRLNCEERNPPLGGDTLWLPSSRFDLVGRSGTWLREPPLGMWATLEYSTFPSQNSFLLGTIYHSEC